MENQIPKIIHYCWFGGKPLTSLAKKCIKSWKKFCPNYEIREWNESNFNININLYTEQAYAAKKYAFVSDFARFDIIYKHGGIYLDVDVELLKNLDELLGHSAYMGFETNNCVNVGLGFGAIPGHPLIREICDHYMLRKFLKDDLTPDFTTVVEIVTNILIKKSLEINNSKQVIADCVIYPMEYFQPIDNFSKKIKKSQNTFSIHHYASSWYSKKRKIAKFFSRLLGVRITRLVKKILSRNK